MYRRLSHPEDGDMSCRNILVVTVHNYINKPLCMCLFVFFFHIFYVSYARNMKRIKKLRELRYAMFDVVRS